jgi:RNA recognition motif-containing protein
MEVKMQESKLYVGNLSYSATSEELKTLFSEYGQVQDVKLFQDKGFGFVEMTDPAEAGKAKEALDGFEFKGRKIKVDHAKPPREKQSRDGGGGGYRRY